MRTLRQTCWATLAALLLLSGCGHSSSPPPARPRAGQPAEAPGPLLWRVDGPSGPVYLYGTIHIGEPDDVPPIAWERLASCNVVAVETDIEKIDQRELVQRGLLPAGESLEAMLGKSRFETLVATVTMVPRASLARMKPWMASMLVLYTIAKPPAQPMDLAFVAKGRELGQKVEFLETWQQQFDAMEASTGVEELGSMLDDLDKGRRLLAELTKAYLDGDAARLAEIIMDPSQMTDRSYDLMIRKRNQAWLPALERYAAAGNVFVAVGAAHLVGPESVVALLRAKGYRVTREVPAPATQARAWPAGYVDGTAASP